MLNYSLSLELSSFMKQTLINNWFPNYIVETDITNFINKTEKPNIENTLNHKQSINLY